MDKKILFLILLAVLVSPISNASAQLVSFCGPDTGTPCVGGFEDLLDNILIAMWIIFGFIAIVCFIVAGIMFLTAQGAPEKINMAKSAFIWGIAGVVVGIIAYSIISIVGNIILVRY